MSGAFFMPKATRREVKRGVPNTIFVTKQQSTAIEKFDVLFYDQQTRPTEHSCQAIMVPVKYTDKTSGLCGHDRHNTDQLLLHTAAEET